MVSDAVRRLEFPFPSPVTALVRTRSFSVGILSFGSLLIKCFTFGHVSSWIDSLPMAGNFCDRINVSQICCGIYWVPLNILSNMWLLASNANAEVAHRGPQFFTPSAKCVMRCTLKVQLVKPYNVSMSVANLARYAFACDSISSLIWSPSKVYTPCTSKKMF